MFRALRAFLCALGRVRVLCMRVYAFVRVFRALRALLAVIDGGGSGKHHSDDETDNGEDKALA